jgi:hypothetical protein
MALVIKGGTPAKNKKDEKRQMYTWGACIFVTIFIVSLAIPLLSSKKDDSAKYNEQYFDLAALPFNNDEAEKELLASAKYHDISKVDLVNTLFSIEEKEERQARDEAEGVPAPPDEEYKAAAKQKEKATARAKTRAAYNREPAAPTQKGSFQRGNTASVSGGSGASMTFGGGNTSSSNSNTKSAPSTLKDKVEKDKKAGGRGLGFMEAYKKSDEAAKQKNADVAAGMAAEAFQGGKGEGLGEGEDELEELLSMASGQPGTPNAPGLLDLASAAAENSKDDEDKKGCDGIFSKATGKVFGRCIGAVFLDKLINSVFSMGEKAANIGIEYAITGDYKPVNNSSEEKKDEK